MINSKAILIIIFTFILLSGGGLWFGMKLGDTTEPHQRNGIAESIVPTALAAKFEYLSQNGNSSCGGLFNDSILNMLDGDRLLGSCCSPMDLHRYGEQVEGLKDYVDIPEIPPDPYDIDAGLAKQLKTYYDVELTEEQQPAYNYAMANSDEKGPCCCKCWRWYVYGGLGKLLIQQYSFTGAQVAEVWDLSDGCGGAGDHANH